MASGYHRVYDSEPEIEFDGVEAVDQPRGPLRRPQSALRRLCSAGNILYIGLIVSNIFFAGLWARDRQDDQCVRPKLVYSLPGEEGAVPYEKSPRHQDLCRRTGAPRRQDHPAADRSAYIVEPAVYHELHCIKRVRRHLHLDYYFPDMTKDEKEREGPHIDHCLEYWREAAMCRADIALSIFYWNATSMFPASRVYSDHECVGWEYLDVWSRSRMFIINDKHDLQDPWEYRK